VRPSKISQQNFGKNVGYTGLELRKKRNITSSKLASSTERGGGKKKVLVRCFSG